MSRSTRKALLKLSHALHSHLPTIQWPAHPSPLVETLLKTADLGLTCFGGPAVHFQVFHHRFVTTHSWLPEPVFQELFAVTQSLSGPASTKMLYCIALRRNGFLCAVLAFFLWSLPGAAGMYALSQGVTRFGETLPDIAYAVLSGLNAATVGMIALAAVQLSEKAITDRVSRGLVLLGACAGMLYNALWYFPVIIAVSGLVTLVWDSGLIRSRVQRLRRRRGTVENDAELTAQTTQEELPVDGSMEVRTEEDERIVPAERELTVSWKLGAIVIAAFFASFIAVMVARGAVTFKPLLFALFSNMYLAGTIIFGGGPVVIPLLRE
jgi:chromate transport protein ChrA